MERPQPFPHPNPQRKGRWLFQLRRVAPCRRGWSRARSRKGRGRRREVRARPGSGSLLCGLAAAPPISWSVHWRRKGPGPPAPAWDSGKGSRARPFAPVPPHSVKTRSDQGLRSPGARSGPPSVRAPGLARRRPKGQWRPGADAPTRARLLPSSPGPLGGRSNFRPAGTGSSQPGGPESPLLQVPPGARPRPCRARGPRRESSNLPSAGRGQTIACVRSAAPGSPSPGCLPDTVLAMVLAVAGLRRPERRGRRLELQSANAAVPGRGGSEGGREAARRGEEEREREVENAPGCGRGCSRQREGPVGGERSARVAATGGPSSHQSLRGLAAPHPGFVHWWGDGGDSPRPQGLCRSGLAWGWGGDRTEHSILMLLRAGRCLLCAPACAEGKQVMGSEGGEQSGGPPRASQRMSSF